MVDNTNIFTRAQVHGPADYGTPLPKGSFERIGPTFKSYWLGKLGDAISGFFKKPSSDGPAVSGASKSKMKISRAPLPSSSPQPPLTP